MNPVPLDADPSYVNASSGERAHVCNGCGSAQAKFDFIPDTLWGLKITRACNIHDWDYYFGLTIEEKAKADRRFMNNMLRLIEADKTFLGRVLKPLRRRRALKYYEAVLAFGGPAFWNGKIKPSVA